MKKLLISSIFILVINWANAQDLQTTLGLAKNSLSNGDFVQAELYYRRVMYFDASSEFESQTIEGLANTTYALGNYEEASNLYLSLSQLSGSHLHYYMHVISLLKMEKWIHAKRAAFNMVDSTDEVKISKNIFLGLSEYGLRDFDLSKKYLAKAENLLLISLDDESIFKSTQKIDRKSRTKAIIMSGIIPGLGQAYSRHYKEALNSFLLISSFAAVYNYTIINLGFIDAVISILPWFQRYYVGGMNRAAELVEVYKDERFLLEYNKLVELYGPHIN